MQVARFNIGDRVELVSWQDDMPEGAIGTVDGRVTTTGGNHIYQVAVDNPEDYQCCHDCGGTFSGDFGYNWQEHNMVLLNISFENE